MAYALLAQARVDGEAGRFDAARAGFKAAQTMQDGKSDCGLACKWAALEFKAGATERAEELVRQAETETGLALPFAYQMLIEAIRIKLSPALKKRFDQAFTAALDAEANPAAALAAVEIAAAHHSAATYHGQKTHEKKVLAYLGRVQPDGLHRAATCESLSVSRRPRRPKVLRQLSGLARRRFPNNPIFPLSEAESHLGGKNKAPRRVPGEHAAG